MSMRLQLRNYTIWVNCSMHKVRNFLNSLSFNRKLVMQLKTHEECYMYNCKHFLLFTAWVSWLNSSGTASCASFRPMQCTEEIPYCGDVLEDFFFLLMPWYLNFLLWLHTYMLCSVKQRSDLRVCVVSCRMLLAIRSWLESSTVKMRVLHWCTVETCNKAIPRQRNIFVSLVNVHRIQRIFYLSKTKCCCTTIPHQRNSPEHNLAYYLFAQG